jgi:4-hydroxy-tetrahydrodipicolinate reductase
MKKIIINGASGKMGKLACEIIPQQEDLILAGKAGRNDNLAKIIQSSHADIVVDLTRADCVFQNALNIIENNAHPVIGSSGLTQDQIRQLTQLCEVKNLGGIIVPNFSIAAVLMMQFAEKAAQYLEDVEIIEAHHAQKIDAPSGTALKSAELIAAARKKVQTPIDEMESIPGARGGKHHGIAIHSLRMAGFLAEQRIVLGNLGETLTITHTNIDRIAYMPGLLLACRKVSELNGLVYGLEYIMD